MTFLRQLHDGAVGLLLIDDGHGGVFMRIQRSIGIGVGAADEGDIEQGDLLRRIVRTAAEKNDALQALFPLHHGAALDLVVTGADLTHDHGAARRVQIALDGADDAGVKRVLHAAHHQADGVRLRAHKATGGIVGEIVMLGDDAEHAAAALLADVGTVIEDTGDRTHAHAAEFCYVLDGHGAPPSACDV